MHNACRPKRHDHARLHCSVACTLQAAAALRRISQRSDAGRAASTYMCGTYMCGTYMCGMYMCGTYMCGTYMCGCRCFHLRFRRLCELQHVVDGRVHGYTTHGVVAELEGAQVHSTENLMHTRPHGQKAPAG